MWNPETRRRLIVEPPVLVLPEQRLSDRGESIALQQSQTLLEGVVDLNFAIPTNYNDTTGAVIC
jgi:hypothetical protein